MAAPARYYKSREGEGPFDRGAVPTIVRRPLGSTMRHRVRVDSLSPLRDRIAILLYRKSRCHYRGITWRGQTSRSVRDRRPLSACFLFAVAERGYFRVSSGYGRVRYRRPSNRGNEWEEHHAFRKKHEVDRFYHFLSAISTANPANTTLT